MPHRNTTRRTIGALIALFALSLSCDTPSGPDPDPDPTVSLQTSTVSASQTSIVANGSSTSVITVVLKDGAGIALTKSAGTVSITSTRGAVTAVTDQNNGSYVATLTSSTTTGVAVISATLGGAQLANTASVTFTAGPASAIAVANAASNGQSAVVGALVANPPSVKVTDANGNAVSGVQVAFAVASGGGSITGPSQTTNAEGIATVGSWRLGNTAGPNSLTATISVAAAMQFAATSAFVDRVVTFTATATPGTAGSIAVNGGDGQTAVAGSAVATAPSVKVSDASNNPVGGVTVNFSVTNGGGSITGSSAVTNASGIATVGSWTLGDAAGPNVLTAAAVGVSGSVTISATGIAGAAASMAIANTASNNQSAVAGAQVAIPPSVKVVDAKGNPVANVAVTFAAATGGGSITGGNAVTSAAGIAQVGSWTLGGAAGPNSLTATSASLSGSPITFTATGLSGAAGSMTVVAGNGQTAIAGTNVAVAPSVKVTDSNGNIVAGAAVTFTVASGGGSVTGETATTNASGIATVGSWRLGNTAGTNTLTASSSGVTPMTFTATGTAGAAALIVINAGNNQFATSGTIVAIPPSVKVTDANGNVVAGAAVTFAVASGGGSVNGATPTTDASGIAAVTSWFLGAAGANSLTASLNGVSGQTVTFNATATALSSVGVTVGGRLERGQTVTLTVVQDGTPLASSAYTVALVPADGGTVNPDGTIKLLKQGSLAINVTAGQRNGSAAISIAMPPLFVFDMFKDGFRHVWQAALDGKDLTQLTINGSDNQHPSRVGDKLTYASARNGQLFDIFSMTVSTGTETNLTSTAGFAERDPNFSPNGQRITFVSGQSGLDRARYMNADGSGLAFVADNSSNTGAIDITPAWSPNSDKVIFATTAAGGSPDLWITTTLGGIATKLAAPANTASFAEINGVWNASNQIAFHTNRSGNDEIWITNIDGTTATKLTDGASPTWTADGRIVFVRFTGVNGSLFWIDPAAPSVVTPIDVGGFNSQRPSVIKP